MRANATTMPPSRGMAPPESPVPAPRPTSGTLEFARDLDDRRDIFRGARKHHQVRPVLIDAAVVLVEQQILRPVEIPSRSDQPRDPFLASGWNHCLSV